MQDKVTVLVLGGAVWGAVVGLIAADSASPYLLLALGLGLVIGMALWVGQRTIWIPWERLLQLGRAAVPTRPQDIDALPTERRDELGYVARVVRHLSKAARRHERDAAQLRRTIDHRIGDATRAATQHLTQIAMRDPLTNLGNRRFLDEHIDAVVDSCLKSRTPLQCVMIDLDYFKQVNDQLGHEAGDALLMFLGDLIRSNVRQDDLAIRIGGDEFVVLMPGGRVADAMRLGENLRGWFDQHCASRVSSKPPPGLSIGIASLLREKLASGADLLRLADTRLYAAKTQGRGATIGP
ncbi:MAG: hypothetical protein CMJ49_06620 [Planctomycetaceae bacterium]|nr:hypothetical protein [Planctomycetaceae bacterium]